LPAPHLLTSGFWIPLRASAFTPAYHPFFLQNPESRAALEATLHAEAVVHAELLVPEAARIRRGILAVALDDLLLVEDVAGASEEVEPLGQLVLGAQVDVVTGLVILKEARRGSILRAGLGWPGR
jgi:hypothetical protein